jgi:phenylalanyl-tRNA synthetase alpha subunit
MKTHPILSYYTLDPVGTFHCNKCSIQYKHPIIDTLKRHYARNHKEIWNEIKRKKVTRYGVVRQNVISQEDQVSRQEQDVFFQQEQDQVSRQDDLRQDDSQEIEMDSRLKIRQETEQETMRQEVVRSEQKNIVSKQVKFIKSININDENSIVDIIGDHIRVTGRCIVNFK